MSGQSPFSGQCGSPPPTKWNQVTGLLIDDTDVTINGSTDLSTCIFITEQPFFSKINGFVYGIRLLRQSGTPAFRYILEVDAQAPAGFISGMIRLKFTDQTGDVYDLVIWSSSRSMHTLYYNSDKPYITTIAWADRAHAPIESLAEEEMLAEADKAKAQECDSAAEASHGTPAEPV